jgi:D-serine deaminase-like pyridoxal phosphate-dependent protein
LTQRSPARVGDAVAAIETPALALDLAAFERNLDRMAAATRGLRLRPHAKAHKCPDIARLQIARGAVGVCCQKTDEAAAFVEAGIADVLVTNEIVAPSKIERLVSLARNAAVGVLVDDPANVSALANAARASDVSLDVYVEINVGANRCGVEPGVQARALAQRIVDAERLRFRGLHAYHGGAQHLRSPDERRDAIMRAAALTRETRRLIEAAGIECAIVTGAGTGTWHHEAASGVWNELQPGSYPFMDADYGRNALGLGDVAFEQSLFVLSGVMSVSGERAIVDAGLKAFAFDSGVPLVHGHSDLVYAKASDEHGVLTIAASGSPPRRNDRVFLIPGHCDPTFNLYDWVVGYRGDRVEAVWPISARGALG